MDTNNKLTLPTIIKDKALYVSAGDLYLALNTDPRQSYDTWMAKLDAEFGLDPDYDIYQDDEGLEWLRLYFAHALCHVLDTAQSRSVADRLRELDRKWREKQNTPTSIMAWGVLEYQRKVQELEQEVSALKWEVARLKPKADYFDRLVERRLHTSMADTATAIGVAQADFRQFLLAGHYIRQKKSGRLLATRWAVDEGLFDEDRLMVTPKGRETFRLLCQGR